MADVTTTFAAKDESFAKTVGNLQGRLTEFSGSVSGFSSQVAGMASAFSKLAGPIAGIASAFFGVKAAAQAFSNALSMGSQLDDLSTRTGASAGEMLVLGKAFELAGSSADNVGPTITRLQRFLAEASVSGSEQSETLYRLGLTYQQLAALTPTEQMRLLADRISAIEEPTFKAKAAVDVFSKAGGDLIPLLAKFSGELSKAQGYLGSLPRIMDENAAAFADLDDNVRAISNKFDQFVAGLITGMVPALNAVADKLANLDAAGLGEAFSNYITSALKAMANTYLLGDAIDSVKLAIEAITQGEIGKGLELMWVTMKITALNAINEIVRNFMAGLQTIGDFIGKMFSPSGALVLLIQTAFTIGASYFKEAIFSAMAEVSAHFGPWGQKIAKLMLYQAETVSTQIKTLTNGIGAQIEEVGHQAADAGAAMPDTFAAKKAALDPLFNLKDEFAQQKALQEQITAKIQEAAGPAEQIAESARAVSIALADVPGTLQTSVNLSGELFTNLNNASLGAQNVGKAFELGANYTGKMAIDLTNTSASANQATNWMQEANYETSQMSLNGSNFAASAALAAGNIRTAKVDAQIAADAFSGMSERMQKGAGAVNDSLDKMREAHHFGRQTSDEVYKKLTDGGMNIHDANKAASDYMTEQSKMSSDMQKAELQKRLAEEKLARAEKRAQEKESFGQQKAADDIRRRAEAAFTKKMEEIAPGLEKGVEIAKKMLEESGKKSGEELKKGADEGGKAMKKAGEEVAKALKDVISPEGKDKEKNFAEEIFNFFKNEFFVDFKQRLPQNVLS